MTSRAIVLARGLGTRMRARDDDARLTPEQARLADAGLKAMMPVNGRPFLEYSLSALADTGVSNVALIVAPDHAVVREYFDRQPPTRVRLSFVIQDDARGTADAVLSARLWLDDEPFLCLNADNLYPVGALRGLADLDEPGLLAFERADLIASSNIPAERITSFAIIDVDDDGWLRRIVEKPSEGEDAHGAFISMNCWRFDSRIFDACRDVPKSTRGEYELPEAVALALQRGTGFRVIPARGPVLDLSRRADAADLDRRLVSTIARP